MQHTGFVRHKRDGGAHINAHKPTLAIPATVAFRQMSDETFNKVQDLAMAHFGRPDTALMYPEET